MRSVGEGLNELCDGTWRAEQQMANITDPTVLREEPAYYREKILRLEGVVATPPSPQYAIDKARIEAEVDGFIASMKHAREVRKEVAELAKAVEGQDVLVAEAAGKAR